MPARRPPGNWTAWLESWDRQQESFNRLREARFEAMMDAVEAQVGRRFHALDLGSGPGSFSARILRRFPSARVTAVDYDPVVQAIGRGALGTMGGRLEWVDAKLAGPRWVRSLTRRRYDAAVSTTALHWLRASELTRLYADLARLVRRGGLFVNGDFIPWGPNARALHRLSRRVVQIRLRRHQIRPSREWGEWERWWKDARQAPALRAAFAEHDRRHASHPHGREEIPLEGHVRRLRAAGFRQVDVVWQDFQNRVLLAIR